MAHAVTEQALVLRAYDIGEADRFCILLTERLGKITARARAVRKMKSRFGGSVLPLQRVNAELKEGSAGYLVTGAECIDTHDGCRTNLDAYRDGLEACNLILTSLPDEESSPETFVLACDLFDALASNYNPLCLIAFKLRLLDEFGSLPSFRTSVLSHERIDEGAPLCFSRRHSGFCLPSEDPSAMRLSPDATSFLRTVFHTPIKNIPTLPQNISEELRGLVSHLSFHQFTVTSAPSRLEPLPVGSPSTPTW